MRSYRAYMKTLDKSLMKFSRVIYSAHLGFFILMDFTLTYTMYIIHVYAYAYWEETGNDAIRAVAGCVCVGCTCIPVMRRHFILTLLYTCTPLYLFWLTYIELSWNCVLRSICSVVLLCSNVSFTKETLTQSFLFLLW